MRRFIMCLGLGVCLLMPGVAMSAPRKGGGEMVVSPANKLSVSVSKGVLVHLPHAAGTIFVAEPEIASYQVVSDTKILVFGKVPGQTSLFALDGNGAPFYSATVSVQYDTDQMHEALQREFPSLTLKLTPAADGIIVSGEVPSSQIAANVVSMLDSFVRLGSPASQSAGGASAGAGAGGGQQGGQDSGDASSASGAGTGIGTLAARNGKVINRLKITMPTQVNIRVRVAEVNRTVSEKLGFKWQYNKFGTAGGTPFFFGLADTPLTGGTISALASGMGFAGMIDALAEENMVSILAEPNLSVVSGETASFLAGGQMPFPVSNGNDDVSIEFKDFGVLLGVTPTILSPQRISLRLRPEVSEPSPANGITWRDMQIPGFVVRRAETTVELASGQSFAIGGLLQNSMVNEVSKIPGLGDIPILGALARSKAFKRGETELIIIATAYIVEPSEGNLRIPNAKVHVPNVFSRLFLDQNPEVKSGTLSASDLILH